MVIATISFYVFALLMVVSALVVITAKNPVHSVLFLILAFFNSAGLFILLGAEFIAMLMVIVYVGAVAVLFLFVVMMLNVDFAELKSGFVKNLPAGLCVALVLFVELFLMFSSSISTSVSTTAVENQGVVTNTNALGMVLYTDYLYVFQISGIILLIAMIGAITLTLRSRSGVRRQDISKQVSRTVAESIEIVKVQSGKGA